MQFVYAPTLRSARQGSGPEEPVLIDPTDYRGPRGTLTYDRPLTKQEIEDYALSTIDMPRVVYYVYGVRENGHREFLMEWPKPMPGAYDAAVAVAEERGLTEEFIDYVVEPKP